MRPHTQTIIASILLLLNTGMAIALWPDNSNRSLALLITIAVFAAVWLSCRLLAKRKGCDWSSSKARRDIIGAITMASLILLAASLAIALRDAGTIQGDLSKRFVGVIIGAVLVVMGNAMPKKLAPIDCNGSCATNTTDPARAQKLQRFMGWTFVLAGLIYMGIWITIDLDKTGTAVLFAFPAAIAIIIFARLSALRHARSKAKLDHPV
tara:strand:- start:39209 stop:39835 length:627 start_codon:yes stop_codon:yes gene_type:complete